MQITISSYKTVSIGDTTVCRVGLGTNRLTDTPQNHELLKHAASLGINFIDTANIYQSGASEKTIGNTLSPYPEDLVIATKGGMVPGSDANNEPEHLREAIEESLKRLKTNCITLYQLHRVNPETPIEETMNFFELMQKEGKIKHIGLSEVTVEQIERARNIIEITSVQNHYNLNVRKHERVVDYCERNNIIFIPFFPLDSGRVSSKTLNEIAKKYNCTPHQLSIAWLLKRSPIMLPIPGTLSMRHLDENQHSLNIMLSDEDYNALDRIGS
jgi:aryl-alcohol dehydrogenase-like predicted oxidoreductase